MSDGEALTPEQLLAAHGDWVRKLARSLVRDAGADDLAQDVWETTLRNPPRHAQGVRAWLAQVLLNRARNRAREGSRRAAREAAAEGPEPAPSPEDLTATVELQRTIAELVGSLPPAQQQVVYLRFYEGLEPTEIAARLGVPAGTVRWRSKVALDELRRRLDERFQERRRWAVLLAPLAQADEKAGPARPMPRATATKVMLSLVAVTTVTLGVAGALRLTDSQTVTSSGPPREPLRPPRFAVAGASDEAQASLDAASAVLSGKVSDVRGGAIAGARIETSLPKEDGTLERRMATTDGEGRFRLVLPRGEHSLRVAAEGYLPAQVDWLPLTRDLQHDVTLVPGSTIAGRVVRAADNVPVAGASVLLIRPESAYRVGATSPDGTFSISGLPAGPFMVGASKDALTGRAATPVDLSPASRVEGIRISLAPGAVVSGHVRRTDGQPVAGARVMVEDARQLTGADGAFRLEGLLPGSRRLHASGPDFATARRTIVVPAEGLSGVDLTLEPQPAPASITGLVVTADGRPVVGARMHIAPSPMPAAISDEQGRFRLPSSTAETHHLVVHHPVAGVAKIALAPLPPSPLRIVLSRGAHVRGRVRWNDGAPARGVFVGAVLAEHGGLMPRGTVTDDEGGFRLGEFTPGTVVVTASRQPRRPTIQKTVQGDPFTKVQVTGAGEIEAGVLVLGRGGGSIKGVVLLPDGRPAAGAAVRAQNRFADSRQNAVAGPDGAFVFHDLDDRLHTVTASHPGLPEGKVQGIEPGGGPVRIQLHSPASLAGRVRLPDGRPAPSYSLALLLAQVPGQRIEPRVARAPVRTESIHAADGAFELRDLGPETYELVVTSANGLAGHVGGIAITPEHPRREVELTLRPEAIVTGKVVELFAGTPLAGVGVALTTNPQASVATGADGSFRIQGAVPGSVARVVLRPASTHIGDFALVRVPEDARTVDIGTVKLARGQPQPRGGTTGLGFVRFGRETIVDYVTQRSPGERAGVQLGEVLLSIDGQDARGLPTSAVRSINVGEVGAPIVYVTRTPRGEVRRYDLIRVSYESLK